MIDKEAAVGRLKGAAKGRTRALQPGYLTVNDLREAWRECAKHDTTPEGRKGLMRELLTAYYESPEGQAEIQQAPLWLREKPISEIVELLLQDAEKWDESGYAPGDSRGDPFRKAPVDPPKPPPGGGPIVGPPQKG